MHWRKDQVEYASDWPVGCTLQLELELTACSGSFMEYAVVCRPGGRGTLGSIPSKMGRVHYMGSPESEGVLKTC